MGRSRRPNRANQLDRTTCSRGAFDTVARKHSSSPSLALPGRAEEEEFVRDSGCSDAPPAFPYTT